MIYKANPAYRILTDEQAAITGPILEKLCKAGKGSPCDIVKAAEPETSELHPYFTWDDSIGGFNWRKQEARNFFRAHIRVEKDGTEMDGFVSVPCVIFDKESAELVKCGRIYKTSASVVSNDDDYAFLCSEIRQSINAFRRKLKSFEGKRASQKQLRLLDETAKAFE